MDSAAWSAVFSGVAALVALGALTVGVVALRGQHKDRQTAKTHWEDELLNQAKDQARLITSDGVGNGGGLSVRVHNHSGAPVSRVRLLHIVIGDDESTRWEMNGRVWQNSDLRYQIQPGEDTTFHVDILDADGKRRLWAGGEVRWTIEFVDASQRKWLRVTDQEPVPAPS